MPRRSRATETRSVEQRPDPQGEFQSTLYFPKSRWPKGMTCRWIRVGVREQPDNENWAKAHRDGWKPCPIEMAPEYLIPNPDGSVPNTGIIRINNHILCQKPTKDVERARNGQQRATSDQLRQLEEFVKENPDADIPRYNRSSPTEHGVAPASMFKEG